MTTQTPATAEIEKLLLFRLRFFHTIFTPGPDPGLKEKHRTGCTNTVVLNTLGSARMRGFSEKNA